MNHEQQYGRVNEFPSTFYKVLLKRIDVGIVLEKANIHTRVHDNAVLATLEAEVLSLSYLHSQDDVEL